MADNENTTPSVTPATPVAPATPTPEPTTPVAEAPKPQVTADTIKDMMAKKDLKGMRQMSDSFKPKEKPKTETPVTPATPISTPAEAKAEPASEPTVKSGKKYVVGAGDKKLELHDEDGFLGYKDADGLKKSLANNVLYNQTLKTWAQEAQQREAEAKVRLSQLETQLKQFQSVGVKPSTTVQETPLSGTATPAQTTPPIELKQVPPRPDLPDDMFEWDAKQKKEYMAWEKEMTTIVNDQMVAIGKALSAVRQGGAQVDASNPTVQALAAQLEQIKKAQEETSQFAAEMKAQKQQLAQEVESSKFWDEVDGFASTHTEEFKTPTPLKELHKQIVDDGKNGIVWMDTVAMANGIRKPYGGSEQDWGTYLNARAAIVQKYLGNDKQVLDNCTQSGVVPPNGYKEYFEASDKINNLIREKTNLIQAGVLGKNATLQQVWHLANENNLNPMIRQMETQVRADQTKTVVGALQDHQANHAVNVPPEMAQAGQTPMNDQKVRELLAEIQRNPRNPELRKKLKEAQDYLYSSQNKR